MAEPGPQKRGIVELSGETRKVWLYEGQSGEGPPKSYCQESVRTVTCTAIMLRVHCLSWNKDDRKLRMTSWIIIEIWLLWSAEMPSRMTHWFCENCWWTCKIFLNYLGSEKAREDTLPLVSVLTSLITKERGHEKLWGPAEEKDITVAAVYSMAVHPTWDLWATLFLGKSRGVGQTPSTIWAGGGRGRINVLPLNPVHQTGVQTSC